LQQEVLASYNNGEAEGTNSDESVVCKTGDENSPLARRGNLEPPIKEFCKDNDQKLLTESDAKFEKVNSFGSPDQPTMQQSIRAEYWKDITSSECPSDGNRQVREQACIETLTKVMDCSTDGNAPNNEVPRYGGSAMGDNCVVYIIDLQWANP
jgi:hypothetical protein